MTNVTNKAKDANAVRHTRAVFANAVEASSNCDNFIPVEEMQFLFCFLGLPRCDTYQCISVAGMFLPPFDYSEVVARLVLIDCGRESAQSRSGSGTCLGGVASSSGIRATTFATFQFEGF
jgi:hypothetical protein